MPFLSCAVNMKEEAPLHSSSAIAIPWSSAHLLKQNSWEDSKKKVIVVVVKGTSVRAPVSWALEKLAHPGDVILVLGLLTCLNTLLKEITRSTSKTSNKRVHDKIMRKRKEMETSLSRLYSDSIQKGVELYLDVKKGKVEALGIGHAIMLKATHVVLGRELKMYKKDFIEHMACIIIQMRRKSPPSTWQGIQSTVAEASDTTSVCKAAPPTPQASPHVFEYDSVQNQEMNTELFSIEIEKQPSSRLSRERIEYCSQVPEGSIYLADTLEWTDSIYSNASQMTETPMSSFVREHSLLALHVCNSPMFRMGQALDCNSPSASTTTSRTPSFRSLSTRCNSSEFYSSLSSNNYSDTSLRFSPSRLKELADTSSETNDVFQITSTRKYPKNIQESVKVISVQPRIAHTSHLVESLLIVQGLTSDNYPFSSQQQQQVAVNSLDTLYPGQFSDSVDKIMNLEEKATEVLGTTAHVDTTISPVFVLRPFFLLDEEQFYSGENSRRNFSLGAFFCSVCKQVPPNLGKRPVLFSYDQLSFATNSFSTTNLLGGDETGLVYKGLLKGGHYIAVKNLRQPCPQEYDDCLIEIELLSCAQHRNLVMLLGYCAEDSHFMLVYEYVCNKSLSWHLAKENNPNGPEWWARQKIAVGAARGLRYLHEECHGGCIVHREIRADNIFLTHDFLPMVGNFGLAWLQQAKTDSTKVQFAGHLGYLGATREVISWKADVYAFGVVLLELITGRKVMDKSLEPEQQNLADWARPLLLDGKYHELLDSRLESSHDSFELVCMVRAATLCTTKDPSSTPQMSRILRILEGGNGKDDESPYVEDPFSDGLPLVQCEQKNDRNPNSLQLQVVTSKLKRKSRGVSLTYDEMLQ